MNEQYVKIVSINRRIISKIVYSIFVRSYRRKSSWDFVTFGECPECPVRSELCLVQSEWLTQLRVIWYKYTVTRRLTKRIKSRIDSSSNDLRPNLDFRFGGQCLLSSFSSSSSSFSSYSPSFFPPLLFLPLLLLSLRRFLNRCVLASL